MQHKKHDFLILSPQHFLTNQSQKVTTNTETEPSSVLASRKVRECFLSPLEHVTFFSAESLSWTISAMALTFSEWREHGKTGFRAPNRTEESLEEEDDEKESETLVVDVKNVDDGVADRINILV